MAEKVTELSAEDAREFFLRAKCYSTIDLPKYFDFQPLLTRLADKMSENQVNLNKNKINSIKKHDKNNYIFYQNKDGNLSWRKFQLINPFLYVYLVTIITDEDNWNVLKDCFLEYKNNPNIECCSIPQKIDTDENISSDSVINWWKTIELRSIELSLSYNWIATTDLTDCYGSLYTHSISWAVCKSIEVGKNERSGKFHNDIDDIIQSMNYGQTNGIPQGSVLMDYIAELLLGFSDYLLSQKITDNGIVRYKILRYRDDYKIFTETKEDAVRILRLLSEVSAQLNFKLNTQKTFVSQELITDSIKPDKLYWNNHKQEESFLFNHLLLIHGLAKEHSNSGSIKKSLSKFIDRITPLTMSKLENLKILIALLADIAAKNSNVYSQVVVAIGKILAYMHNKDEKQQLFDSVVKKFESIPNSCFLSIWLQRLALKSDLNFKCPSEPLCSIVESVEKTGVNLWEHSWMSADYEEIIQSAKIVNSSIIDEMPEVPDDDEVKLFVNHY